MADYNINKSDGTPFTISTGTINNTFDIPFIGQDAINYGDDLAQANLRLLENFANTTAPSFGVSRTRGQLWYDTTPVTGRLNLFDGASWDVIPLDVDVVHNTGAEPIDGIKTFTSAPAFDAAGAGFTIANNTLITNLNAQFLGGLTGSAFATAAQGVLADGAEPDLLLPPVNGYVLASDMAGNRSWVSLAVSSGQIDVTGPTIDTTTNVLLVDTTAAGLQDPRYAAGLTYNASTGRLVTLEFQGTLIGNADTATTATTAATATTATSVTVSASTSVDTTTYPLLVGAPTATDQLPFIDNADLSYNASTGTLSALIFSGSGASLTALNLSSGTHTGTLAVTRGGTGVGTSTGSGSNVLNTSPTFATSIITPVVNFSAGVSLQYNGTTNIQLGPNTGTGETTSATIRTAAGTLTDIGLNLMPISRDSPGAGYTLEKEDCGHMTLKQGTTAFTITMPGSGDGDFPIGGVHSIINGGASGTITIADGGETLYYLSGTAAQVDVGADCALAVGGVATIYRATAAVYYIWGSRITA